MRLITVLPGHLGRDLATAAVCDVASQLDVQYDIAVAVRGGGEHGW